jgi:hypothetical protein
MPAGIELSASWMTASTRWIALTPQDERPGKLGQWSCDTLLCDGNPAALRWLSAG